MRRAIATATAILAATTATGAALPVPTILPAHAKAGATGWPHQATRAEMLEATRAVHRYTRFMLPRRQRAIRTACWTGPAGIAGRYACRIRNNKGGTRGVPYILRAATLHVWEDGSWELTYRGRTPDGGRGGMTFAYARPGKASSAVYTGIKATPTGLCCQVDRSR